MQAGANQRSGSRFNIHFSLSGWVNWDDMSIGSPALNCVLVGLHHCELTCVWASVNLQVLQPWEALVAGGTVVRLLIGMSADVDQHFIPERQNNTQILIRKTTSCSCSHSLRLWYTDVMPTFSLVLHVSVIIHPGVHLFAICSVTTRCHNVSG